MPSPTPHVHSGSPWDGRPAWASARAAVVSVAVCKQLSGDRAGGQLCGLHRAKLQVGQGPLSGEGTQWTPKRFQKIPAGALPPKRPLSSLQGWEFQRLRAFPAALPAASLAVTEPGPGGGAVAAGAESEAAGARHPPCCPRHHHGGSAHRQVGC